MPLRNVKEHKWTEENMRMAVNAVRRKTMGYLAAAKHYNVPRSTLFRYCNNDKEVDNIKKETLGRKPVLTRELESKLVEYILLMEKKFFGLTRRDLCSIAFQLARQNNLPNPFSLLHQSAGKNWMKRFLRRHKEQISLRRPTGTSTQRAAGFNKESVDEFFGLLETIFEEKKYTASQIFNVDECGICIVQSKCPQVLALKGKRQIGSLTSAERGSLITVVMCMSAEGNFVPPLIIFPRKNCNEQLKKGAPPGTLFKFHPSGWIQTDLFTAWFDHFIEKIRPSENNPVLLILDGHNTHTRNLDVIVKAKENFVTILCLPPHTSHKMQPLDKTVMGALKTFYNEEIRMFLRTNQRAVTHFDVCELFGRAYLKVHSAERAVKGFAVTGIYPLRRDVFTDEDFLAASHRDDLVQEQPLADLNRENREETQCLPMLVNPEDIVPVPTMKKKIGTRGRKPGKAKIITSTPNKEELEKSINSGMEKREMVKKKVFDSEPGCSGMQNKRKHQKKLKIPAKRQKRGLSSSCSESNKSMSLQNSSGDEEHFPVETCPDDAICLFCEERFSTDTRGEIWVMCAMCNCWAHDECAGAEKDTYICDFCS